MTKNIVAIVFILSYFLFLGIGLSYETYTEQQCKTVYANSNKTVAEIKELCE